MQEDKRLEYFPFSPPVPKYFIVFPHDLILAKDLSDKRVSCLQYINRNLTLDNTVAYCPIYMITWCGYKPNWNRNNNKSNMYTKFLECMNWMWGNGYIIDFDSEKFIGQIFQCSLVDAEKIRKPKRFGIVYDFEIDKIMSFNSSYKPLSKSLLLLVLSYIRLNTWNRKSESTGHSEKSKKEKPEICHKLFIKIAEDIGVSVRLVSKAIHVLTSFGFIALRYLPRFQDEEGNWHTEDTIFITPYKFIQLKNGEFKQLDKESYDFKKELAYGIKFVQEQGYNSKKFYQE